MHVYVSSSPMMTIWAAGALATICSFIAYRVGFTSGVDKAIADAKKRSKKS